MPFLAGRKEGEEGLLRLVTDNVLTYFAGCHLRRHHSEPKLGFFDKASIILYDWKRALENVHSSPALIRNKILLKKIAYSKIHWVKRTQYAIESYKQKIISIFFS